LGRVQIDQCTNCHGVWFDAGEAEALMKTSAPNILARVFRAVAKGVTGSDRSEDHSGAGAGPHLTPEEYARIVAMLGRTPTFPELGIFSAL